MKLSTRGRYGIRALLELAIRYGQGPVLIKDIAATQQVSPHYLEQIVIVLKAAGLIKSVRGAKGGIQLAKKPSEINLGAALKAQEGSMAPVECVDNATVCTRSATCATRDLWVEMRQAIDHVVASRTLEDLLQMDKAKHLSKTGTYNI
jgi:Rrf2 family cysteine metabolism transcriptional repressor